MRKFHWSSTSYHKRTRSGDYYPPNISIRVSLSVDWLGQTSPAHPVVCVDVQHCPIQLLFWETLSSTYGKPHAIHRLGLPLHQSHQALEQLDDARRWSPKRGKNILYIYIYIHMSLYLREKGGGWSDLFVIFRCLERRGSEVKGKGCI